MPAAETPIAIVTGGSWGIGSEIVVQLRARGIYTASLDVQPPASSNTDLYVPCDVSDAAQVQMAIRQVGNLTGRIIALVNCAGTIEPGGGLEGVEPPLLDQVIGVNLKGPMLTAKYALPYMKSAGGGSIVNISSITGISGSPSYPVYAATKSGLINLGLSLARALARFNIRVNTVCPGSVPGTTFIQQQLGRELHLHERLSLLRKIPLRKVTRPVDIARWVVFLCTAEAGPVTGSVITIDGAELWGR